MSDESHPAAQVESANEDYEYSARLAAEEAFFHDCDQVHALPAIFHYWSNKFVLPKIKAAGFGSMLEFFTDPLLQQCDRDPHNTVRFVSIGAGNCDKEIEIAEKLLSSGRANFVIDCLDVNQTMLDRGSTLAKERKVADHIHGIVGDFNQWQPMETYHAVIAIQALHHVVNLEGLFHAIKSSLTLGGRFLIGDMIGRNGHQRWPETLAMVHEYWRTLPPSYRYNHMLKRYEELYQDWDCSTHGFEGIRSQDILPLLVERFQFHSFIPYGGIVDPFIERRFGPNFDAASEWDRSFIDAIHDREEQEMAQRRLTPTNMFAIVGNDVPEQACAPNPAAFIRLPDVLAQQETTDAAPAYRWNAWPHASNDELRIACQRLAEATAHAQTLQSDREIVHAHLTTLTQDFAERTEWALRLKEQLAERTTWALELQQELQALKTHLQELRVDQETLRAQYEERTQWALAMQQRLEEMDERTAWALRLEKELAERTAHVQHLSTELVATQALIPEGGRLRFLPSPIRAFLRSRILRRT